MLMSNEEARMAAPGSKHHPLPSAKPPRPQAPGLAFPPMTARVHTGGANQARAVASTFWSTFLRQ